ncbi:hypothetical protein NL676_039150 [Syzygium grande]|nr:hypothetical protein NL676_039150 [Syzygium grande]
MTFFFGEPFKPFDQLMGTLPSASASALPEQYRRLMTDPSSPILDFYPSDFEIDMNGKKFAWQGVAKLPFIDEKKLLTKTRKLEVSLTKEEQLRIGVMFDLLYVHPVHSLSLQVHMYYQLSYQLGPYERYLVPIDTNVSGGMNGFLWLSERNVLTNVIPSPIHGLEDIVNNQVYNVTYLNPAKHKHIPKPPAGVVIPPKVLGPLDIKPFPVLWHEDNSGRRQNGRERPSVPGAMVGPMLGEAAHRLVKSTLNIKLNNSQSSCILEPPRNRKFPGYYAVYRPRPTALSGYERGFSEDAHQYHGNHNYTII